MFSSQIFLTMRRTELSDIPVSLQLLVALKAQISVKYWQINLKRLDSMENALYCRIFSLSESE